MDNKLPNNLNPVSSPTQPPSPSPQNPAPTSPNNAVVDPVQSWIAKHETRDSSGRLLIREHYKQQAADNTN